MSNLPTHKEIILEKLKNRGDSITKKSLTKTFLEIDKMSDLSVDEKKEFYKATHELFKEYEKNTPSLTKLVRNAGQSINSAYKAVVKKLDVNKMQEKFTDSSRDSAAYVDSPVNPNKTKTNQKGPSR